MVREEIKTQKEKEDEFFNSIEKELEEVGKAIDKLGKEIGHLKIIYYKNKPVLINLKKIKKQYQKGNNE